MGEVEGQAWRRGGRRVKVEGGGGGHGARGSGGPDPRGARKASGLGAPRGSRGVSQASIKTMATEACWSLATLRRGGVGPPALAPCALENASHLEAVT